MYLHIDTNNGDDEPLDSGDEKNVLNIPNREKPALTCQVQGSVKSTKGGGLLLNPTPVMVCFQTTILSSVALNNLE